MMLMMTSEGKSVALNAGKGSALGFVYISIP